MEIFRRLFELAFGIGIDKGRDIVGHHQHLINFHWVDDIILQYIHKVQPPRADHVVREYDAFIS